MAAHGNNKLSNIVTTLTGNPKKFFLADAAGAMLTGFMLAAVLYPLQQYFGMPAPMLILLAGIAAAFAIYSFCCYRLLQKNYRPFIQIICFANMAYCCLSVALVIIYFNRLTAIGVAYFITEIVIILCVVLIEFKTIARLQQQNEDKL